MRLKQHIIANIFAIGMSPFVMNVCACCIVIFINNRLLNYGGDMAIGAFGILNRIQMLFGMIVMGITMGMQPITGYNYGAQHFDRVKRTLKLGITAGCIITTLGFIIGELFPGIFVGMFTDNHELTDEATLALRIGILSFPVVGAQIVITQFFQSIGKARTSIFLSLSRQLLFLLPGPAFLPPFYGVKGVWFSMPLSDALAFAVAALMLAYHYKKKMSGTDLRTSYPTNTPGWWGGAHPFALLDTTVVHNGEISSYDANRRFIEMFGYSCDLLTDTEVITYIIDYLGRKLGLTYPEISNVIAAPFWSTIEKQEPRERERLTYLRNAFASLMVTGPFSILVGYTGGLMALNDRLKLRSMVVGEKDDTVYIASEECAIRVIQPELNKLWAPKGGEPVIVNLKNGGNQ